MGEPLVNKVWLREENTWRSVREKCQHGREGADCVDVVRDETEQIDSMSMIGNQPFDLVAVNQWLALRDARKLHHEANDQGLLSSRREVCVERLQGWYAPSPGEGYVAAYRRECQELPANLSLESKAVAGWVHSNTQLMTDIHEQYVDGRRPPSMPPRAEAATPAPVPISYEKPMP